MDPLVSLYYVRPCDAFTEFGFKETDSREHGAVRTCLRSVQRGLDPVVRGVRAVLQDSADRRTFHPLLEL